MKRELARPVIFGLADGAMSILGVVFMASGHPSWVLPFAIGGGLSASVSMAAGQWLSDSDTGPGAAAAIGLATLAGSILPALPYATVQGRWAPALSMTLLFVVALVVGRLRTLRRHPYVESFVVLAAVIVVSVACALLLPGGVGG